MNRDHDHEPLVVDDSHIIHMMPKADPVNHPKHYNSHPSGIEAVTICEHFAFNVGNTIKYMWRAGLKTEDPIEDLRKAAWYVNREIERLTTEKPSVRQNHE